MSSISERAKDASGVRMMPEQERPLSEQYRIMAKEWVTLDAAARLLEDTKSSVYSQIVLKQTDVSVSRAEHLARAHPDYLEHIEKANKAREDANLARVKMKWIEMRFAEWTSSDANQRAERKMVRQAT